MNDKAALELSVNAIVILIIALVVLGLIIGFVVSKFHQAGNKLVIDEPTPEPDSYSPIQTPGGRDSFTFTKKSQVQMEVRFYNMNAQGFDSFWTNATQVECVGEGDVHYLTPDLPTTYVGAGEEGTIALLFTVDPSMPAGVYACQLVFRGESYYVLNNGKPDFETGKPLAERYLEIEVS